MLLAVVAVPPYQFEVHPTQGLQVSVSGVPVISGSWFQVYEPDWSKQHFASASGAKVETASDGTVTATYRSADGRFEGKQEYRPEGGRLVAASRFLWKGDKPVRAEVTGAMLRYGALQAGTLNGQSLSGRPILAGGDMASRELRRGDEPTVFQSPLLGLSVGASRPTLLFDARGYDQPWARNRSLLWLGFNDVELRPNQPVELQVVFTLNPSPDKPPRTETLRLPMRPITAVQPTSERLPLVPKPRKVSLNSQSVVELTGNYRFPVGRVRHWEDFLAGLRNRFVLPRAKGKARVVAVDGGISKLGKRAGGYEISIRSEGRISVLGEEEEGLRNGLRRLAMLAFVRNGKLVLPTGRLEDEPAVSWRGVHLFVGPEARPFQRRLWERVLLPLGMNRVVLQCERTQWQTTPIAPEMKPMERSELAALFSDYRKAGVEPIPLIQSLGHMGWFFAGDRRKDLAINPEIPFTLDYRKPEAVAAIRRLWVEAAELLKPKAMHFGCDEIDMRGFGPDSTVLATDLWEKAMPELGALARSYNAEGMIWGDKALGPGEAVDATHGENVREAARRRRSIPKGFAVADWHYRADPRPEVFTPSLQLWKREGFRPIASGWYRPENVRGFALAAARERTGYLQTTWAGYWSNESAMKENFDQFSAMVLAADYAWSGRDEGPEDLGYSPSDLFCTLYFREPMTLKPQFGRALGGDRTIRIGRYGFRELNLPLRGKLTEAASNAPSSIKIPIEADASRILLALTTDAEADEGAPLAEVTLWCSGKKMQRTIRYGENVRAGQDLRSLWGAEGRDGLTALELSTGGRRRVDRIEVRSLGVGGLVLKGVTLFE
jgi:hypothetical protein